MFKLLTLSGRALDNTNILDLSDQDAGIYLLHMLTRANPNLTWGDLLRAGRGAPAMGNWFTDTYDFVGRKIKETGNVLGQWGGDAVRLFTDEKVVDGVSRYGTAYATSGGSEALKSLFGDKAGGAVGNFLSALGAGFKGDINAAGMGQLIPGVSNKWIAIGGAGLILLVLLFGRR